MSEKLALFNQMSSPERASSSTSTTTPTPAPAPGRLTSKVAMFEEQMSEASKVGISHAARKGGVELSDHPRPTIAERAAAILAANNAEMNPQQGKPKPSGGKTPGHAGTTTTLSRRMEIAEASHKPGPAAVKRRSSIQDRVSQIHASLNPEGTKEHTTTTTASKHVLLEGRRTSISDRIQGLQLEDPSNLVAKDVSAVKVEHKRKDIEIVGEEGRKVSVSERAQLITTKPEPITASSKNIVVTSVPLSERISKIIPEQRDTETSSLSSSLETPAKRTTSVSGDKGAASPSNGVASQTNVCPICTKAVFLMEQIEVDNVKYHKM